LFLIFHPKDGRIQFILKTVIKGIDFTESTKASGGISNPPLALLR
jgi:hypothetical protein